MMKTLTLLAIFGMIAAAEAPKQTPPSPPKSAMLTPDQAKDLTIIQLQREIHARDAAKLTEAVNALFLRACQGIGGASLADCTVIEPTQAQPGYGVQLKPVAPITAKADVTKK